MKLFVHLNHHSSESGMTLMEVLVVIGMIGLISVVTYPSVRSTMDKYAFRSAAREVLNSAYQARSNAVRDNDTWRVRFDQADNSFTLNDPSDTPFRSFDLSGFGGGVRLIPSGSGGTCGNATKNWSGASIAQTDLFSFTGRGFGNSKSIFLENANDDICFAITVHNNGSVKLRRYNGKSPFSAGNWD